MKQFQRIQLVGIILASLCLASCAQRNTQHAKRHYHPAGAHHHHHAYTKPKMGVVGYERVPVCGARKDRAELSLNRRLGEGGVIVAPKVVLRNPARQCSDANQQVVNCQPEFRSQGRAPDEVIF